jgi:hypothetical protein
VRACAREASLLKEFVSVFFCLIDLPIRDGIVIPNRIGFGNGIRILRRHAVERAPPIREGRRNLLQSLLDGSAMLRVVGWRPDRVRFSGRGRAVGHLDHRRRRRLVAPAHLAGPGDNNHPTWSPDGRFIYFNSNRSGIPAVWRALTTDGSERQVTNAVAARSEVSADGRWLYYQRLVQAASPLLSIRLAGGPERTVIDCVPRYGFAIGSAGVYHLGCGAVTTVPLLLLDPATGHDRLLGTVDGPIGTGLTVSADGRTILYTKLAGQGNDLFLIDNFR